ncbi:bifunctional 2-keto-4-hydroxyglutarate aldolase/2-keto-3-deoxy-6-phosphogluconate aldolase [Paenalkalicoccus suaedae]|uniref:Bifunctional 2-keto-4-hydroxyglutarate aldolase/2-keto-3-deoxy-6-phosphogluconate aldolase n=1 Tax=Paenalkalicoccus suaedae TaxID=2592382 RepID=A0A859FI27_9BACI|nr:bifunctional 2-keto-4-hydroxyglutarate aldolase/2-keto-3-deoxy-6-phosphogluconate aldolase [Paenalkalicoccus suaedae]QKS72498.1 bifunctional 2-keto-4-hydroxyglutarate aldolase/2-keto-3-deoxy-6-phosphogluconate aldolase [Paenalkalicoccus suaedae]
MQMLTILNEMAAHKLAVVVRGNTVDEAEQTAAACYRGGIRVLEVTFTVPGADEVMKRLVKSYDDAMVGAGTVLDAETARTAILAGAQFIVSPGFDEATAKLCNRYHIPYLPGCMTITEMLTATEYGAQIVKLFPGQQFSPEFIRNVKGPLPHMNIMPTGGINLDNMNEWIDAGAVMVGVGGEITKGAKTADFDAVEAEAAKFVQKLRGA